MYAAHRSDSEVRELATQLYCDRYGYLLAIARQNAANEGHAEEALQEAFIFFLREFDPRCGAPPLAWLTLVMKRVCWRKCAREHYDRRAGQETQRGSEEPGSVLESIPSHGPSLEQRVLEFEEARSQLGELKADERTALGFLAAGFTYRETAERHGWTYTKVNRCVTEGRAALRALASRLDNGKDPLKDPFSRRLVPPRTIGLGDGLLILRKVSAARRTRD